MSNRHICGRCEVGFAVTGSTLCEDCEALGYPVDDTPRYIRCYDNGGETFDRYTVLFTRKRVDGQFMYLGMSDDPFHPQGFGQHGFSNDIIDRPTYSHLGKKVSFEALPPKVQQLVKHEYEYLWEGENAN